jgi:hypothetical protein
MSGKWLFPLSFTAPTSHLLLSNRSHALLRMNRFQEALDDADAVVRLCPTWGKVSKLLFCLRVWNLPTLAPQLKCGMIKNCRYWECKGHFSDSMQWYRHFFICKCQDLKIYLQWFKFFYTNWDTYIYYNYSKLHYLYNPLWFKKYWQNPLPQTKIIFPLTLINVHRITIWKKFVGVSIQ